MILRFFDDDGGGGVFLLLVILFLVMKSREFEFLNEKNKNNIY